MADIQIQIKHNKNTKQLKKEISQAINQKVDEFRMTADWDGLTCNLTGPAKGILKLQDKHIDVEISLGLLIKPFKGEVKKRVEAALNAAIAAC